MRRADGMLGEIYAKAGAAERYKARITRPHKFDLPMASRGFRLFERWLKA